MNHRTIKALAVAGTLLVLAAVGCTDTTVQPKSTVTSANIFNDPSSYQSLLARVYAGLAVSGQQGAAGNGDIQGIDEGFSQYLRLYWECEELPTDEAVIGWGDIGLPEMNTMTWTSSSTMVVAMYYRVFVQAAMANEFLRQTTDAALAARNVSTTLKTQIQQWRAEARFLRALSYWHGLDLFGNIPLVKETDPVGGAPPQQARRADIYAYVVSELLAIRSQLPTASAGNYGRATTAAADMLLAELYLNDSVYTGTTAYASAVTSASNVISANPNLDPSYAHLFQADNNTSSELVFPVEQDGNNTQTWGGMTFILHAACGNLMSASTYGIDYCWGGTRLKPEAYNLFAAGDGRGTPFFYTNGQTVAVTAISDFSKGIAFTKFSNKTSTGATGSNLTFVDTDFPVFRGAEAYLIRAEALLRSGGSRTQALADVNKVRERAYGGAAGDITDAQLTLPFILAERGRELMWEGHRRTDLIRFGLFTGGSYLWSWKNGTNPGTATDAHYNLYPLPATELVANPNLTQNTGY